MTSRDTDPKPRDSSIFAVEKNFRHLIERKTRERVERLYKVKVEFREKDVKGQWIELQGDLIDRRNAKNYCQALCNPTVTSIVKLQEPLTESCIEKIEAHTNAVIRQVGTVGQYKVGGSSSSMALALSILNDVKESGMYMTTAIKEKKTVEMDTSCISLSSTETGSNTGSDCMKGAASMIEKKKKRKRKRKRNRPISGQTNIPTSEYQTELSKQNNEETNKQISTQTLSKSLFTKENTLPNQQGTLDGNRLVKDSSDKISSPSTCFVEVIDGTAENLDDKQSKYNTSLSDEQLDKVSSLKEGSPEAEVSPSSSHTSGSDSETNIFLGENCSQIHENMLDSSISSDALQSKRKNKASKRLSVSLISVLNASNARMDNCLEAPDTVKRAILSCLESDEMKELTAVDDSVILVDNDEDENSFIDVSQIEISDDEDGDNDVTVICLEDTIMDINNNGSLIEIGNSTETDSEKADLDNPAEIARCSTETEIINEPETSSATFQNNCPNELVCANKPENTEVDCKSDVECGTEQMEEIVVERTTAEVSDDSGPVKCNAEGIETQVVSLNDKRTENNDKALEQKEKSPIPEFTSIKETNRISTEESAAVKENIGTNAQHCQHDKENLVITIDLTNGEVDKSSVFEESSTRTVEITKKPTAMTPPNTRRHEAGSQKEGSCVNDSKRRKSSESETETADDSSKTKKIKVSERNVKDLPKQYRTPYYNKTESKEKKKKGKRRKKDEKENEESAERSSEKKKKKKKKRKRKVSVSGQINIPSYTSDNSDKFSKKVKMADVMRTPEVTNRNEKDCDIRGRQVPRTPITPYLVGHSNLATRDLRYIVIDGSNVAMAHGNSKVFSCRGILLAVDYFLKRGHQLITVFLPQWRKCRPENPSLVREQYLLDKLEREGYLVFTPSRRIGRKLIASYDDRFILELAEREDGVVVSNDNYRDLMSEKWSWRKIIEDRLLMFSFVRDHFMLPKDPLGRHGPTLEKFLKHEETTTRPLMDRHWKNF